MNILAVRVFLCLFLGGLGGCGQGMMSPGSPNIHLNKNVYVIVDAMPQAEGGEYMDIDDAAGKKMCIGPGSIVINYTTKSEQGVTAKIEQQLKDLLDATLKIPLVP